MVFNIMDSSAPLLLIQQWYGAGTGPTLSLVTSERWMIEQVKKSPFLKAAKLNVQHVRCDWLRESCDLSHVWSIKVASHQRMM